MNFENKLIPGVFVKRYKRFFVDVLINNKLVTCHCPNTGSMMGLLKKGNKVFVTKSENIKRKLKFTLQIIEIGKTKIGVNTHLTNKIFFDAIINNNIDLFKNCKKIERERKYGNDTRFDFYLEKNNSKYFIEVKNVTLSRKKGLAEFPDAPTLRGSKHIKKLSLAINEGFKSYLVFVIQRNDCKNFNIARDIDPEYFELLTDAIKKNLKILCFDCKFSSKGIKLNNEIKFKLNE